MRLTFRQPGCLLLVFFTVWTANGTGFSQGVAKQAQFYFFTNPDCGPCRFVEPELEKLIRAGFPVMKIDTSIHRDWTQRFQVSKTPTVILVVDNKVVGRKSGFVDAPTLRQWLVLAENSKQPEPKNQISSVQGNETRSAVSRQTDTTTRGILQPANQAERLAMQATVRLKIDDPLGSSYATGTVIHSFEGESLVLTCGHVFRDSEGTGTITAEYGFLDRQLKKATGELLFYDADGRDIGLIAISTDGNIQPITVAQEKHPMQKGDQIFSIGCDHGQQPSIRRSRLKNQAKYDGVNKYEIYGRPVNGRSGGGMFTAGGQLVGVCNAAVVDVDEGVYVGLDTIHWQIAKVNLGHLFNSEAAIARNFEGASPARIVHVSPRPNTRPRNYDEIPIRPTVPRAAVPDSNAVVTTNVANTIASPETELILVLRNKNSQGTSESWTVTNPSDELIQSLKTMNRTRESVVDRDSAKNRMAQLRRDMPNLQNAQSKIYNSAQLRAQSPR